MSALQQALYALAVNFCSERGIPYSAIRVNEANRVAWVEFDMIQHREVRKLGGRKASGKDFCYLVVARL